MNKPDKINDTELGDLTYNPQLNWYEVSKGIGNQNVRVSLSCDEFSDVNDLILELRSFMKRLEPILRDAYGDIATSMLPLKNEEWLREGESPVSEKEFIDAIRTGDVSIAVDRGGLAEMFFNDAGHFGGHSIVVWHDENGSCSGAHLAG